MIVLSDVVECRDLWMDHCPKWAADGQCTTDRLLMATICARTCNLCHTLAATSAQPVSHISVSRHNTSLLHAHDRMTSVTSSPVSTQSPANPVSNNSLLTSVPSVSADTILTVSGVTTQTTVTSDNSQLNNTSPLRSVHETDTDRQTMSTAGATLLSLMVSVTSKRKMTSVSRRFPAANDTTTISTTRQSVTSSYTDPAPAITSLRRVSHSSLANITSSQRRGRSVGDRSATDSQATTARQDVVSVTDNDKTTTYRLRLSQLATITPRHQQADTAAITSVIADIFSSNAAADGTSSSFTSVQQSGLAASRATIATDTTSAQDHVSVTSRFSAAAAATQSVSRGVMTSSSRDSSVVTSYDTAVELVSRLTTTDDDDDDDDDSRPHTTPTVPHTTSASAASRYTMLGRHSQSDITVQLSSTSITSINSIITTSTNNSTSSSSRREVEMTSKSPVTTSSADVTHTSADVEQLSATNWSRDTSRSTRAASTHSMLRHHSVTSDVTTTTYGVFNSSSDTLATNLHVSSSQQTTESHQFNTSSFLSTLLSAHDNSDGTSAESISSPSSSSERSAEQVTDMVKSGTAPSTARRLDTTQLTRYLASVLFGDVSTYHTTQLSTVNSTGAVSTRQTLRPSTTHQSFSTLVPLNSSSNVTSGPFQAFTVSSTPPSQDVMSTVNTSDAAYVSDRLTAPSFTADVNHVTHSTLPPFNISNNFTTHRVTGSPTGALSTVASVNVTNFIRGSVARSTSSRDVTGHQTHEVLIPSSTDTTLASVTGELSSSRLDVSEPIKSATTSQSHAVSSSSTQSVNTSAAPVTETTRSRPLWTTTHASDTSVHSMSGRRLRPTPGMRARGQLRPRAGHVVIDTVSFTIV